MEEGIQTCKAVFGSWYLALAGHGYSTETLDGNHGGFAGQAKYQILSTASYLEERSGKA
jgi:hypothetical protein